MDALCLKAGIHSMVSPPISAAGNGDLRPSVSSAQPRHSQWGFTFRHPLRSLWPGVKNRCEPAISVDDAVLVEEKDDAVVVIEDSVEEEEEEEEEEDQEARDENWVFKILHVKSLWRDEGKKYGESVREQDEEHAEVEYEEEVKGCGGEDEECDVCEIDDDEKIEFDRDSFSKLLKKVPLAEARLYAKMSFLGSLAYSIPEIKPKNPLRPHGLRFVTSSIEKKEQALKEAEKEKQSTEEKQKEGEEQENSPSASATDDDLKGNETEEPVKKKKTNANPTNASTAAYQMAASAASYLHSHTRSILRFKSSSSLNKNSANEINGESHESFDNDMDQDMAASLMATTDSVTAVVAAKEEVKQAVADDLKSIRSSPCEWFVCDDDLNATRFFVIQGSESLASWQANLLFEPVQFEGLDFLVHRGIYEAAKGMYEQMLPEIQAHLKSHGERATFRFTGHSLGGSLSLLLNLMLLIRGGAPRSSLLPVITFGAPSIMCGGDHLLRKLRLPRSHVRSITMHRDIVPRAFSCNYPNHVAEFLKAVNGNFRNHPCLNKRKLLYAPMGEFLILQPDDKFSPSHDLLPSGSGLYVMTGSQLDAIEAEKQIRAAQAVFLNSPHPLEILSDRAAYGYGGTIQRDHDMSSYLKSVRNFIRHELNRTRKARREHRRKVRWPLVAPHRVDAGIVITKPAGSGIPIIGLGHFNFSGIVRTGRESLKRFSTLVASQHMHLLVVLLLPARLLVLGSYSLIDMY